MSQGVEAQADELRRAISRSIEKITEMAAQQEMRQTLKSYPKAKSFVGTERKNNPANVTKRTGLGGPVKPVTESKNSSWFLQPKGTEENSF